MKVCVGILAVPEYAKRQEGARNRPPKTAMGIEVKVCKILDHTRCSWIKRPQLVFGIYWLA